MRADPVSQPNKPEPADIIRRTEEFVRARLASESSGHDWWHVHRVRNNALRIARAEQVDVFVVELAALLHDVADWKFHDGDLSAGPRVARQWLESLGVEPEIVLHVCEIIETVSFKGAGVATRMSTREGMVVQDADRLDAIGAIGIGRTFAYGGHAGRPMHDPDVEPVLHDSFEQYKASNGPTINHFYEKLLLIKDRLNTQTARQLAKERHEFMEQFLDRFLAEWEGQA
ncbi:MAG TPA: HD domain-containing protein [Candidatus Obscuribacterales bacterium]